MGTADVEAWDRSHLLRTLLIVTVAGVTLLGGLGYAVYGAVTSTGHPDAPAPVGAGQVASAMVPGAGRRDAIAAAPMLAVPPEAGRGGTPASSPTPAITIPPAGTVGPADVPTGFPETPEGAIGQLAAIETTVLQGMSIERAREVYRAWSVPDAPPVQTWELIADIQVFLGSRAGRYADDLSPAAVASAAVVATPVAAQVKGVDGPGWVVACVLQDVTARVATSARVAYGYCARMQWSTTNTPDTTDTPGTTDTSNALGSRRHGRWVIATGAAPARAPSTWPGTDLAALAGWRSWAVSPKE